MKPYVYSLRLTSALSSICFHSSSRHQTHRINMKTTRLFLIFVLVIFVNFLQGLNDISYSRVHVLDGNYCPDGNVIKEIKFAYRMQCLVLCSEQSTCNGVFLHLDETKCVACSAKYFVKNDTHNSNIGSTFYKRGEKSTETGDTGRVSVFWLIKQGMTWDEAKKSCEELGGQLATVKSKEENDYIAQNVLAGCDVEVWTSGTGLGGTESTFKWLDGTNVSVGYTNWKPGQPYHSMGQVPVCIKMVPTSNCQWNDDDCNDEFYSLCELE
ncbi:uncharacterized protein LOC123553146 isoform X1 [Mercenaria mercenaria]|uniref:uncharacterized protein LOC123553146 isoform X1 n=1 Tax=Mercenaria mercenaria TaxID=6596 RepID=UPI00234E9D80|nr:uncharacterized protein LOC123553146 isoform X1 [Mercenaria mercenaria]